MPLLPPASEVRAILVGIERYDELGGDFHVRGPVEGVKRFAQWLINDCAVKPAHVQMWLAFHDGDDALGAHALSAELGGADARPFDWTALRAMLNDPELKRGGPVGGTFLIVYFCGHGVALRGSQHLVLPTATNNALYCVGVAHWRHQMRTAGWGRFTSQLWLIDACRNDWGQAMLPIDEPFGAAAAHDLRQFVMFACGVGQQAALDSELGPAFTREWIAAAKADRGASVAAWPDFEAALRAAARTLNADPLQPQSPTLTAENWDGLPLDLPFEGRHLPDRLLQRLDWTERRFWPYVQRALTATAAPEPAPGTTLADALDTLAGLPAREGVPPLLEFAERVARASGDAAWRAWVDARITAKQRAELDARIGNDPVRGRLSLWVRDDLATAVMEAELEVVDAAGGATPWERQPAKPVSVQTIGGLVGAWLDEVDRRWQQRAFDLEIELYLPRAWLVEGAHDSGEVATADGTHWRLGDDYACLLHSTDRFKSRSWIKRLRERAPAIFARLAAGGPTQLHWVQAGETADTLRLLFTARVEGSPSWLALRIGGTDDAAPLDIAIAEGLPAVLWLRLPLAEVDRAAIERSLPDALAGPADEAARRLRLWRRAQADVVHRAVSVLLDDDARRPRLFKQFSQP